MHTAKWFGVAQQNLTCDVFYFVAALIIFYGSFLHGNILSNQTNTKIMHLYECEHLIRFSVL